MQSRVTVTLLALTLGCATPAPRPADTLGWLVGNWVDTEGEIRTIERWHPLPDGTLLGSGYAASGPVLVFAESLAIVPDSTGVVYVAWPSGQDAVDFRLVEAGAGRVVFENTAHDFPQRITYVAEGTDTLAVQATGQGTSGPRDEQWKLIRVPETATP